MSASVTNLLEPDRLAAAKTVLRSNGRSVVPCSEWVPVVPLTAAVPAPDFPLEALPPAMRRMVEAVAATTATPVDFPAAVALGAVASLAARGYSVRASRDASWTPPANLYIAGVLPSGEGKSPVLRELCGPLNEIEAKWLSSSAELRTVVLAEKRIAEKAAARAENDAVAGKLDPAEAVDMVRKAEAIIVPPEPRLVANEPTPEAVVRLCGSNGGTLALISDEGAEVLALTTRYQADGKANLGYLLKGFEGDAFISDRAGRDPIRIDRLVLSAVLCLQPAVLDDLARQRANRDRGLLARFLVTMPASHVGSRPTRRPEVPEHVRADWKWTLESIAEGVEKATEPTILTFDAEAREVYLDFMDTVEPRLHPDTGDLRNIVDWGSKAAAHILRLAAVLHLAEVGSVGSVGTIPGDTVRRATVLWTYFAGHAVRAFAVMDEPEDYRVARKILGWITRNDKQSFSLRECHHGVSGGIVDSSARVLSGLQILSEHGYLKEQESSPSTDNRDKKGGRPKSPTYLVNPWVGADNTDRTSALDLVGGAA